MRTPQPWELVDTEQLQQCKVFAVSRSMVRSPATGEIHPFFTIDAGPQVKAVCLPESADAVEAALSATHGVVQTMRSGLGTGARIIVT